MELVFLQVTCGSTKGSFSRAGVPLPSLSLSRAPQHICTEDTHADFFLWFCLAWNDSLIHLSFESSSRCHAKSLGVFMI